MNEISSASFPASPGMRATRITVNQSTLPESGILRTGLSHLLGINSVPETTFSERQLLDDLEKRFTLEVFDAESSLEEHGKPWSHVYFFERGVARLFREAASGKVIIHHFFSENDLAWPVFGRSRTQRNTLCLSTVTPCTVWMAPFPAFRSVIQAHGREYWPGFALVLMEELAETISEREFRHQSLSAQERYQLIVKEHPDLLGRVPDSQLASWLGVVPATFSRLKKTHRANTNL